MSNLRAEAVAEALSWEGTRYHHRAMVKGGGVDCATFLVAVAQKVGVVPKDFELPEYSIDWLFHQKNPIYLNIIKQFCIELCPHCLEYMDATTAQNGWEVCGKCSKRLGITLMETAQGVPERMLPGDVLVVFYGKCWAHGAIILDWPHVIHSLSPVGVIRASVEVSQQLARLPKRFFRLRTLI